MQKELIKILLIQAFEAGRWRGQADLEESIANNLFDAFLTATHAVKSGGECRHAVSNGGDMSSRPVRYNLRSGEWREGVAKSTDDMMNDFFEILNNLTLKK